jgi:hypothetical protein
LKALIRPPDATLPISEGFVSTLANNLVRNCAPVSAGQRDAVSAATPVTCGAAMLVPSRKA